MSSKVIDMEINRFMKNYKSKIKNILITEEEIKEKIIKAGSFIDSLYDGRPILLIGILNGSFVFMADLCRNIKVPCKIEFIKANSYYDGTESSGNVTISLNITQDISKYHVVIVEDIIDTGRTLKEIKGILMERHPLSIHVITLLDKPSRRIVDFKADMSIFTIPDKFVIGYGLDCGEYYRNLPYIAEYEE